MTEECKLYIIKDRYFAEYDPQMHMMDNKYESRPYYCGIRMGTGLTWMIPISSKVEKYRLSIEADEKKRGECIFHYIAKLKGQDRAFLIGDAIPCTDDYILKPFTVAGKPYSIENKTDIKEIRHKLSKFLALVRAGKLKPNADILTIEKRLLQKKVH